jgi:hypothetical protein
MKGQEEETALKREKMPVFLMQRDVSWSRIEIDSFFSVSLNSNSAEDAVQDRKAISSASSIELIVVHTLQFKRRV